MNVVSITGRFMSNPELRITPDDQKVVTARVAIGETGRDEAVIIELQASDRTAEFIGKYGSEGRLFEATARIAFDEWEGEGGGRQSRHYLVTGPKEFRFLGQVAHADEPENAPVD